MRLILNHPDIEICDSALEIDDMLSIVNMGDSVLHYVYLNEFNEIDVMYLLPGEDGEVCPTVFCFEWAPDLGDDGNAQRCADISIVVHTAYDTAYNFIQEMEK